MRVLVQESTRRTPRGMTVIELLIVATVIGILAGLAFAQYRDLINQSRQAVAVSNLVTINRAQQTYHSQNNHFATSHDALQLRFTDAYSYMIVSADDQSFVAQAQYGSNVITINEKGVLTYSNAASGGSGPAPTPAPGPAPAPEPSPTPAPGPAPAPEPGKGSGKGPPSE